MRKRVIVLTAAAVLGFAAPAAAADFPTGTFTQKEPGGAVWAVTFDGKGGYKVARDGQDAVEGKYKVEKDQIEFKDVKGPAANPDAAAGTYKWKLDGTKLSFTKVKDDFEGRASALTSGAWEMQEKKQ
jgi:hypothetical protein